MNKVELRNKKGNLIGWIETVHGGCKQIRDSKGVLLG